jgi:hypothetical protein
MKTNDYDFRIELPDFDLYQADGHNMLCMGLSDGRFLVMTDRTTNGPPTHADWLLCCYTSEEGFFNDPDDAFLGSWAAGGDDLDIALHEAEFCRGYV